jgi:hypothetical protein
MILRSRRACSFLFGTRTVTITNRDGVVSPASIIADCFELPPAEAATIREGIFATGSYSVTLGNPIVLTLIKGGVSDVGSCLSEISRFLAARQMSVSTALLLSLGRANEPPGLEGWMARKQARILGGGLGLQDLAKGLLGLGYGLTPSGDDFIEGVILANEVLGSSSEAIRPQLEAYENAFSRTTLLDALDGQYALPIKRLGDALGGHGDLRQAAIGLGSYGSTSGTDVLAGVWYALDRAAKS